VFASFWHFIFQLIQLMNRSACLAGDNVCKDAIQFFGYDGVGQKMPAQVVKPEGQF
jgi:hypothetical protein